MKNQINFSDVKPSFFVKVNISTIVSKNLICNFSLSNNLTFKVFLTFLFYLTDVVPSVDFILWVSEFDLAVDPLVEVAHYSVIKCVSWVAEFNGLTVLENNCFVPTWRTNSRIKICFHTIFIPAVNYVFLIGSFNIKARPWRMMTCLLTEHFTTVSGACLIGLT